ncbi:MAG: apolipoprotein N-acyltransferase, partial [Bacteroidales bacterium]|nr:apolipoprotein N-acyltransferase [Bacteroidales bacterium]
RRWIARCANTGISAVIDPSGKILRKTSWWQKETLHESVGLRDGQTFFVRHGDVVGRISVLCFLLLLLNLFVMIFTNRKIE